MENATNLVDALDGIAQAINSSVEDEYHFTKTSSHLFNIAYSLQQISETLEKIEAKMK
jgi:hypothetical protein